MHGSLMVWEGSAGRLWLYLRYYLPQLYQRKRKTGPKQTFNLVGMIIVAARPRYGATFFGYLINAASWGLWPVVFPLPPPESTILILNADVRMG
jgi:hypothetical protein